MVQLSLLFCNPFILNKKTCQIYKIFVTPEEDHYLTGVCNCNPGNDDRSTGNPMLVCHHIWTNARLVCHHIEKGHQTCLSSY